MNNRVKFPHAIKTGKPLRRNFTGDDPSMSKVHDVWRQALGNKRYWSFTHVIDSWQFNCLIYLQDLCCKMGGWYDEQSALFPYHYKGRRVRGLQRTLVTIVANKQSNGSNCCLSVRDWKIFLILQHSQKISGPGTIMVRESIVQMYPP